MSSRQQNSRQQKRGKRNFKKIKKQPPKKIDWKTYVAPGSTEWHNARRELIQESDYMKKISLNRSLCEVDPVYLPTTHQLKEYKENPQDIIDSLGWTYDTDMKKFYHNQYGTEAFDAGVYYCNSERYLVPLRNVHDTKGLAFNYKLMAGGSLCAWDVDEITNFWNTRKGKRFSKYIEYRKRRQENKLQYTKKENKKTE